MNCLDYLTYAGLLKSEDEAARFGQTLKSAIANAAVDAYVRDIAIGAHEVRTEMRTEMRTEIRAECVRMPKSTDRNVNIVHLIESIYASGSAFSDVISKNLIGHIHQSSVFWAAILGIVCAHKDHGAKIKQLQRLVRLYKMLL